MFVDDNGIVRFETLDNIAPLQVGLNAALESVSGAFDSSIRIWPVANSSERDALGMGRAERPLYVHRLDTNNVERNLGNNWEEFPLPVEDTGWVDLPITDTTNFELYSTGSPIQARKRGHVVELIGVVRCITSDYMLGTTYRQFSQLPNGFYPSRQLINVMQGSGANRWTFSVTSDGVLQGGRYGPATTHNNNIWLPFSLVWTTD